MSALQRQQRQAFVDAIPEAEWTRAIRRVQAEVSKATTGGCEWEMPDDIAEDVICAVISSLPTLAPRPDNADGAVMVESLKIGDVLSHQRYGTKPGTKAAGRGSYTIRWCVAAFADRSREAAFGDQGTPGPMVVLERLDDNARSQPPGSRSSRSLHSVWWSLRSGSFELERDGTADPP